MYNGLENLERRRTAPIGDRGTIITIVSWLLAVIAICVVTARFTMKMSIKDRTRRLGLDDLFIFLAFLFSIAQTIAVSVQSINALGQHIGELTPHQVDIFNKTEYASCILYIANMGCARISLCLLIKNLLPGSVARMTALVFAGFTALWTISGVLVASFSCTLPEPWKHKDGKECLDIVCWINYVGITNIVVEVLLISIPLCLWNLRTSAGRRTFVSLMFLARLGIVAAVAAQLHFVNQRAASTSDDRSYKSWRIVLCIQIAQNLSVITACLPCLHPFVMKILAGLIERESIQWNGPKALRRKFNPISSQSSSLPIRQEKERDYCAPLATHGLDRSSSYVNSLHTNRFPSNTASPITGTGPKENVFMRSVEIPGVSRHSSINHSSTASRKMAVPKQPPVPKSLAEVGVLPASDYDPEISMGDRESGTSSQASRRPPSEYVFNRSKVISVPEESHLREQREEGQYFKKYYPPLPSPNTPKKPPRLF